MDGRRNVTNYDGCLHYFIKNIGVNWIIPPLPRDSIAWRLINPTSEAPTSEIFFLRCQILPQPSEILPQLQEMVPQALEIIAQLSEILPQLQEMVPQLLEMVPQLIEIIPQVLEMVPQVQEMVKQHCGMISVIDNLFILLFICYIYN